MVSHSVLVPMLLWSSQKWMKNLVSSLRVWYRWDNTVQMPFLVTVMKRQGASSANLRDDNKLGTALDVLEGSTSTQRDLDRLEKWTERDQSTCDGITPRTSAGWELASWGALHWKIPWGLEKRQFKYKAAVCSCCKGEQTRTGLYKQQCSQQAKHLWDDNLSSLCSFVLCTRKALTSWSGSMDRSPGWCNTSWGTWCRKRCWGLGLFSLKPTFEGVLLLSATAC